MKTRTRRQRSRVISSPSQALLRALRARPQYRNRPRRDKKTRRLEDAGSVASKGLAPRLEGDLDLRFTICDFGFQRQDGSKKQAESQRGVNPRGAAAVAA